MFGRSAGLRRVLVALGHSQRDARKRQCRWIGGGGHVVARRPMSLVNGGDCFEVLSRAACGTDLAKA